MKKYNTKKRKQMRVTKLLFATFVAVCFTNVGVAWQDLNGEFKQNQLDMATISYQADKTPQIADKGEIKGVIREVTAYNAGDPSQTDSSPCISANGENICTALALGYKRCAANFVPFGTVLEIENYGECLVVDRMNSRYQNRVDIAMMADEKARAIKFGKQNLLVTIKNYERN
jgi:3D (Asp-Asp-Asp) domain-containing protein